MGFKFAKRKLNAEVADLNLTPMMDLFVALIPFLLLSAAFVRIGGIHVNMPASQTNSKTAAQSSEKRVRLTFELSESVIKVRGFSDEYSTPIAGIDESIEISNSKEGLKKLTAYLESLKAKHANFGAALFHAGGKVPYELSIRALDAIHGVKGVATDTILATGVME